MDKEATQPMSECTQTRRKATIWKPKRSGSYRSCQKRGLMTAARSAAVLAINRLLIWFKSSFFGSEDSLENLDFIAATSPVSSRTSVSSSADVLPSPDSRILHPHADVLPSFGSCLPAPPTQVSLACMCSMGLSSGHSSSRPSCSERSSGKPGVLFCSSCSINMIRVERDVVASASSSEAGPPPPRESTTMTGPLKYCQASEFVSTPPMFVRT
mmetsp:Transcript_55460/g.161988  ORF Transcript_55460/g.161988 Transcript_55460/m.161988 type:complete len:213 (-) Transcript_55460:455-1093(-)